MGYAFISYSSKDKTPADAIRSLFNKNGIETWMAPYDIPPGSEYAAVITDAIRNCTCFVLLLSNDSQSSKAVKREIDTACVRFQKSVITVQLEDLTLNDAFIFYIGSEQIIPIKVVDENTEEIQKILSAVGALTGKKEKTVTISLDTDLHHTFLKEAESKKIEAPEALDKDIDYGVDEVVRTPFAPDLRSETESVGAPLQTPAMAEEKEIPQIINDIAEGKERLVLLNATNSDIKSKCESLFLNNSKKKFKKAPGSDFTSRSCYCKEPLLIEFFEHYFIVGKRIDELKELLQIRLKHGLTTVLLGERIDVDNRDYVSALGEVYFNMKIAEIGKSDFGNSSGEIDISQLKTPRTVDDVIKGKERFVLFNTSSNSAKMKCEALLMGNTWREFIKAHDSDFSSPSYRCINPLIIDCFDYIFDDESKQNELKELLKTRHKLSLTTVLMGTNIKFYNPAFYNCPAFNNIYFEIKEIKIKDSDFE